tara:strand:- start:239046 stop:239843 length:798 start_codon:yes stop_codon:yes gene_type:complete
VSYRFIDVKKDGRLLIMTIDRPEVMNAISPAVSHEMSQALDVFEADEQLWVAIITGAGSDAFSAGGDISVMSKAEVADDYQMPATGYAGITARKSCNKPIIAAVNGVCFGGGFEVALACDLIVASENARFALPEPRIGSAAVAGGIHRLVREVGLKSAMALMLTGDSIDAAKAKEMGLVMETVAEGQALEAAIRVAERLLRCAPLALRATKECAVNGSAYPSVFDALDAQDRGVFSSLQTMLLSQDIREGLDAFVSKRRPTWRGV